MKLSVSVMAHPARREHVEELLTLLDCDAPVAWATNPRPSRVPMDRWRTGRAAWEMHDASADYHMVVQDDALPAAHLHESLETALDNLPPERRGEGYVLSAYLGTKKPEQPPYAQAMHEAERTGAPWIRMKALSWGPAIIAPVATIPEMLAWGDRQTMVAYDKKIGIYYRDFARVDCLYPFPSLVDHQDTPSLLGHMDGRRAHKFLADARDMQWNSRVVDDPRFKRR